MNGDESRRIAEAVAQGNARLSNDIKEVGAAVNRLGERTTRVETLLDERQHRCDSHAKRMDRIEAGPPETTNVGPAPQPTAEGQVKIPIRWLVLLIALALGGGSGLSELLRLLGGSP